MISIICPSNDSKCLNRCLISSLKKQTFIDYELIIVDTVEHEFNGAVEALMHGVKRAKGDIFMFLHQDIEFLEKDSLNQILNYVNSIDDYGIIGFAGVEQGKGTYIGNIKHGNPPSLMHGTPYITSPKEVFTLDELGFIIKKNTLTKYPFDMQNKTWHLYCVEYCLAMHLNNKKVIVIPSKIYHATKGISLNSSYYVELKRMWIKYHKHFGNISTTIGYWRGNTILFYIQLLKRKLMLKKKK